MLKEAYSTTRNVRRDALERLAKLSAESTNVQNDSQDMARLCALGRPGGAVQQNGGLSNGKASHVSSIPMSVKELEVLVALCRAAPLVQTTKDAEALLGQLAPYVAEAHRQAFGASPLHQQLPPWETISYDLTTAVLSLGLNHPSLRSAAWTTISEAVDEITTSAENTAWLKPLPEGETEYEITDDTLKVVRISVGLLGFLNGIAKYVQVWSPDQRMSLLPQLRRILSEKFMVSLEGALSAIRNSFTKSRTVNQWKRWDNQYASQGRPLGAMLLQQAFMRVVEESTLALLPVPEPLTSTALLDTLLQHDPRRYQNRIESANGLVDSLTELVTNEIKFLDDEADYLKLGSVWQQKLAREVKASALQSFLCCCVLNGGTPNDDVLLDWLSAITADPDQMVDEDLAKTVLKSMAVLASISETVVTTLTRSLPSLIVNGKMTPATSVVACECLARVLKPLSQDVVISTLYSLGNVLSVDSDGQANNKSTIFDSSFSISQNGFPTHQGISSSISLVLSDEEDTATAYSTVVQAIVAIAVARSEAQLTALVSSMLLQKITKISPAVDARIIIETAALGLSGGVTELKGLLRIYARINSEALAQNNSLISAAVLEARSRIAVHVKRDSPFFEVYVLHLLAQCVSSGETPGDKTVDTVLAQKTIACLLRPLALLASQDSEAAPKFEDEEEVLGLGRDAWLNIVVHGYTLNSQLVQDHIEDLQTMALYSLPLVDEARVDMPESGIDLDPVLRRGKSDHAHDAQRHSLKAVLPQCDSDLRSITYQESVFLSAALLISTLRARAGDCTATLPYFLESKVKTGPLNNCMLAVSSHSVDVYLQRALSTKRQDFAAPQVAVQLAAFLEGCCHRIAKVQVAAVTACDRIISQVPSALCQKSSLFALLELLSLMWKACLDTETDEYSFRTRYTSHKANVSIQLSDDAQFRQSTLTSFHQKCRSWVTRAIRVAPLDVKGILQAYLEDYEDGGAYGHIALGRSFAVEMGELIPASDQRLTSLDSQRTVGINTASDFIAQYTTRQQYRQPDGKHDLDEEWALVDYSGRSRLALLDAESPVHDEAQDLRQLSQRLRGHAHVSFEEVGTTLRNAAGVISRSNSDRVALIQDLVAIPFSIFTKQSIRLGISLWLGVIKENPSLESRVLVEVAAGWEASTRLRKGFFSRSLHHLDPFYIKEEFAPSSWEQTKRREKITQDLVAPHLALTHFLSSHFNASRLTSTSVERVYGRLMRITLAQMKQSVNQPLAREVHFHIILLALNILQHCTSFGATTQWRLKDAILSAGLAWFANPPKWSFGSNRLQVKAERKLLGDVSNLLSALSGIGARATKSLPTLHQKEALLLQLIKHEVGKLTVWIGPLGHDNSSTAAPGHAELQTQESTLSGLLSTAWRENPRIAVQLASRFPNSLKMKQDIRQYILREPEKAICEPDALYILLGAELPADVKTQLKYLLYWSPINPMAAVTYFMPAYKNHPLVIQYAVRALESHSVDVTFFYVPQIVQTLRYDELGYVQRYIIEAGVFSGLFAHQIIWNLKANAFKDEDSEVPDPAKPVFDRVMDALIDSFTSEDKGFYEREFDFFGKVTGISGTLKPLIKRPKPEKKAKIEEELRKIEVEVGVYLPSNPDGVVIGIDRKSGKPLQSHAKAPFMATFRIRKEEADAEAAMALSEKRKRTYEVWQSAIFKVGDDCRQDVLALQLIAAFRGIFNNVGLDVYVFPYRVTATAPGCGVIDVLPNSISRDMLGREAVNGLYEYFVSKYGSEDSIKFQQARSNFIKSMAAYSIISYLLQFKDRHNGNIMVDDAGHILHIDFGFCFDIAPGGVKFERAPFKLTPEMVAVMGGKDSQAYRQFEELCVKVFLASRQYVEQLSHIVLTMLDSGLPCFKPQTIQHFKERFVMEKSDREAAEFVRKLVHWSERSHSTAVYDYFQLLTNGIPY
ncbi:Putative phosphatidylinositol 3-/4-kinase, catalytic domain, protein kinase-like domain superfamily [Septoria linicola]|uniref:1-phosphatidylinositol 4-kinase n=1 Tax=Septoria linicola TaxID=215465 RepID=A0A9Q9AY51_9PEZI|nr:Putative phosphatidylinositol 3-/4-kinase, catalytic domain, protein kinase-like domain superfamily [Septoria linicola]